jgi:hypothetical protein
MYVIFVSLTLRFRIDPAQSTADGDMREFFLKRYCVTQVGEHFWEAVPGQLGGVDRKKFNRSGAENVSQMAWICDVIDLIPSVEFTAAELLPLLKKKAAASPFHCFDGSRADGLSSGCGTR